MDLDSRPRAVVDQLGAGRAVLGVEVETLSGGTGAAGGEVARLHLRFADTTRPVGPVADWLVAGQLEQRLAVSCLDWEGVDVEPWGVDLGERREELLDEYRILPRF